MNISRSAEGEVSQVGHVVRVTHGAAAPMSETMQAPNESAQAGRRALSWSAAGGGVAPIGIVRHQEGASRMGRSGTVMSTLQTDGAQKTVCLVPGVEGSRTPIEVALREGLIREFGPGLYEDTMSPQELAATMPAAEQQQQEHAPSEASPFDRGEDAIWSEAIAALDQTSYNAATAGVVSAILRGSDDLQGVAQALAEAEHMPPEEALEYVETGMEFYKRTLTGDLTKRGLLTEGAAEDFYAGLRGHPRLNEALQQFATQRRTDVFRELALEYKRNSASAGLDQLRDQFARAGMQVAVDHATGAVMVQQPGGSWVPMSKLA